jgi:hypothetical protein
MENFDQAISNVNCTTHSISFNFNNSTVYNDAKAKWDWVNQEGDRQIFFITNTASCGSHGDDRQPYNASEITFGDDMSVQLTTAMSDWESCAPGLVLIYSTRGLTGGTSESNITKRNTKRAESSVSIARDFSTTLFSTTQGPVNIELDCSPCDTKGSVDFDFAIGLIPPKASITATLNGAAIDLGLQLKASGQLTNEISQSINLATIPLDGLPSISGIANLGLNLVITGNAGISAISAEVTTGFGATIGLSGSATLDVFNPDNDGLNGFSPTFTPIQPSIGGQVSVSGNIGPEISLQLDATIIGKGLAAGIGLMAPSFGVDLSIAGDTNGGVCDGTADVGVNFDITVGAEVDVFAGLTSPDDRTPNRKPIFSTSTPLFSTCVPVIGTASPSTAAATTTMSAATSTPTITTFANNCCSGQAGAAELDQCDQSQTATDSITFNNGVCTPVVSPNGSGIQSISIVGQNNCSSFFFSTSDCSGVALGEAVDITGQVCLQSFDFSDGGAGANFFTITCNSS